MAKSETLETSDHLTVTCWRETSTNILIGCIKIGEITWSESTRYCDCKSWNGTNLTRMKQIHLKNIFEFIFLWQTFYESSGVHPSLTYTIKSKLGFWLPAWKRIFSKIFYNFYFIFMPITSNFGFNGLVEGWKLWFMNLNTWP